MKVTSKSMALGTLIALTLALISVTSVFAVGFVSGSSTLNPAQGLESRWKNELITLQRYRFLDNQVGKWIDEWAQAHPSLHRRAKNRYANEVHLALQQAETLVARHPGFDANGKVINNIQAAQSIENLENYLKQLRSVFFHKFQHRQPKHKH